MKSKSLEFNKEDLKRLVRNMAVIYSPVILLSLDQMQKGEFDYRVLYLLAISVTIDFVRRLFSDYTKE